jgi:hypothetical protein
MRFSVWRKLLALCSGVSGADAPPTRTETAKRAAARAPRRRNHDDRAQ